MSRLKIGKEVHGKTIGIRLSGRIELSIDENPTTGYIWAIDAIDENVLQLEKSEFNLTAGTGIGGGGLRVFFFSPVAVGHVNVGLKLWREWEGEASVTERLSFAVRIKQ